MRHSNVHLYFIVNALFGLSVIKATESNHDAAIILKSPVNYLLFRYLKYSHIHTTFHDL